MTITPAQCREARALLGWTTSMLARKARITGSTISRFEAGTVVPYPRTLQGMERALRLAGVIFVEDGDPPSVQLKAAP